MSEQHKQTRRDFLRAAIRGALLALLAGGAAALVARRPDERAGETCVNAGICRGCPGFSGCGLPQALSAKRAGVRGDDERTQ